MATLSFFIIIVSGFINCMGLLIILQMYCQLLGAFPNRYACIVEKKLPGRFICCFKNAKSAINLPSTESGLSISLFLSESCFLWLFPNSVGSNPAITTTPIFDVLLKGLVFCYFVLVAVIDLEYRAVLFPVVIAGILLGAVFGFVYHGWISTLLGFVAGFGIMLLLYFLGKLFIN